VLLAHFSDVHALAFDGARPWHFLSKRAAGWANVMLHRGRKHPLDRFEALVDDLNRRPVDHIVCTGDLTNLSLEPEFRLARSIVDRLRLGPHAVTLVPGNHDVYTLDAQWNAMFARAFRPYLESDDHGEEFPVVRVRGELAIVGVSSARPSPVPFADGKIGARQLAAVAAALDKLRGKFRVLALHHPPYKNRVSILRGLRDRGALAEVLRTSGCELVLHGHEHRDVRRELHGIPVIGVGSGTYASGARYNVYHIERGQLQHVESREFPYRQSSA
jgi:3',5'-cyclic AMP phosphodiesterase CpdA